MAGRETKPWSNCIALMVVLCFFGLLLLQSSHNHFKLLDNGKDRLMAQCPLCLVLNSVSAYEAAGFMVIVLALASIVLTTIPVHMCMRFPLIGKSNRGPPSSESSITT